MLAYVRMSGSEADADYVWVALYTSTPQFPAWESNIDLLRPLKDFFLSFTSLVTGDKVT